jgi:hypothetical protein
VTSHEWLHKIGCILDCRRFSAKADSPRPVVVDEEHDLDTGKDFLVSRSCECPLNAILLRFYYPGDVVVPNVGKRSLAAPNSIVHFMIVTRITVARRRETQGVLQPSGSVHPHF